jgi:hypothetical protein
MSAAPETTSVDPLWYKDAVIYQLHVKTFHDSNGDGIGDFRGLIEKLDYLQELGVTGDLDSAVLSIAAEGLTATTSPTTTASIRTTERCRISRRSSPPRTSAGSRSSPSW